MSAKIHPEPVELNFVDLARTNTYKTMDEQSDMFFLEYLSQKYKKIGFAFVGDSPYPDERCYTLDIADKSEYNALMCFSIRRYMTDALFRHVIFFIGDEKTLRMTPVIIHKAQRKIYICGDIKSITKEMIEKLKNLLMKKIGEVWIDPYKFVVVNIGSCFLDGRKQFLFVEQFVVNIDFPIKHLAANITRVGIEKYGDLETFYKKYTEYFLDHSCSSEHF